MRAVFLAALLAVVLVAPRVDAGESYAIGKIKSVMSSLQRWNVLSFNQKVMFYVYMDELDEVCGTGYRRAVVTSYNPMFDSTMKLACEALAAGKYVNVTYNTNCYRGCNAWTLLITQVFEEDPRTTDADSEPEAKPAK